MGIYPLNLQTGDILVMEAGDAIILLDIDSTGGTYVIWNVHHLFQSVHLQGLLTRVAIWKNVDSSFACARGKLREPTTEERFELELLKLK